MSQSKLLEKGANSNSNGPQLGIGGTSIARHALGSSQSNKEPAHSSNDLQ